MVVHSNRLKPCWLPEKSIKDHEPKGGGEVTAERIERKPKEYVKQVPSVPDGTDSSDEDLWAATRDRERTNTRRVTINSDGSSDVDQGQRETSTRSESPVLLQDESDENLNGADVHDENLNGTGVDDHIRTIENSGLIERPHRARRPPTWMVDYE